MLSLSEAQAAIRERIVPAAETERVPLAAALGRYLAKPLTAQVDNPAFDNSAMDGYALCHASLGPEQALPLAGEAACGSAPGVLVPGTAMRIFTGGPMPAGADAVVMQEDVVPAGAGVQLRARPERGENVRYRGEDFRQGAPLYSAGHRVRVFDLALIAAAGLPQVEVARRPRALVVSTGDELVAPGQPLAPGQIYESNRLPTLAALTLLGADAVDGGTVRDDPAALRALLQHTSDYDFVLTSGGASVGDHDLVKQVFAEIGEIQFWRVRIKPGKPIAFGRLGARSHFFALPGNPVSSLVTFKLFVEPALHAWHQAPHSALEMPAVATTGFRRKPGRMEFLRACLYTEQGRAQVECLKGQGSHMLAPIARTNALIRIAEESAGFAAGDTVTVLPL